MEIGSIYELNPEIVPERGKPAETALSLKEIAKYKKKHVKYTMSGRSAIALALRSLVRNRPGIAKKCLMPAYMCDTVFFPFEREGWDIHFYHINRNLEADAGELRRLAGLTRPGLLFIHAYYGVDTWKPMRSLLQEWKKQGICIMEDVTQSYYLESAGQEADYVVGSLRKWYPLPDGGFVASEELLTQEEACLEQEFTEKRVNLLTKKWEYLHGKGNREEKKALKAEFLKENREMECWLDTHKGTGILSMESAGILPGIEEKKCLKRRSENYRYLCGRLRGKTQFWPVFSVNGKESGIAGGKSKGQDQAMEDVSVQTAPLYFAVYALDRDGLQHFLTERGIYAPVLWPVGKENKDSLTEDERYIYSHILALPMDQRYGYREMEYMADMLEEYELLFQS